MTTKWRLFKFKERVVHRGIVHLYDRSFRGHHLLICSSKGDLIPAEILRRADIDEDVSCLFCIDLEGGIRVA